MLSSPHLVAAAGVRRRAGFSLLEVVVGVALIAILSSAVVGAYAPDRRARVRAEAELLILSQALAIYRHEHGDYPRTGALPTTGHASLEDGTREETGAGSAEATLIQALSGRIGPGLHPMEGRCCLSLGQLNRMRLRPDSASASPAEDSLILDPWGRPYLYFYRAAEGPDSWSAPAYRLYSRGPDGAHAAPIAGLFPPGDSRNADNIEAPL